ncbi:MAG: serine/threonine protein kinase [Polyangiaceae bacterium]|nr:serine/threonine protein kinase [Polyangiaceae bacterium]MCL4754001.1 serine/threonine protein kinase [Myxococcales bacterium]
MSSLPPLVAGRYRPLRVLGKGGMGVVYVVEHVHTGEQLALKVLSAQAVGSTTAVERFKREARVPAQIKSEHVVRVTDADVAPELGALFLVMELLEGSDLDRLSDGTPRAPERVLSWFRQLARGLDKAHRMGIVHRDLKPENLFLTHREDGSDWIKILDFGIAKFVADGGAEGRATETGNVVGTPRYMAPEQATGEVSRIGPAVDVWALGMIAFRLLGGRDYWTAPTIAQLIHQIVYEPLAPPSARGVDLGPAFDAWFARSCARDPADRWPSVGEQVEALAQAVLGVEPQLAPSAIERIGVETTLAVTPGERSAPPVDAIRANATGSLAGAASAAVDVRRRGRGTPLLLGVLTVLVLGVGVWFGSRAAGPATDLARTASGPAQSPTAPIAPSEEVRTPEPSASAITEPPDAGSDAGPRPKAKPRPAGDPLQEQF